MLYEAKQGSKAYEKYCKAVKNNELVRRNNHIDDDKIVH